MILGFAYKANSSDFRNTKVIEIYNELTLLGITVDVYDPLVDESQVKKVYHFDLVKSVYQKSYNFIYEAVSHHSFSFLSNLKIYRSLIS